MGHLEIGSSEIRVILAKGWNLVGKAEMVCVLMSKKLEALQKPPNLCKMVDFPSSFVGYGISQNGFRPSTSSLSCCRSLLFGWCAAETLRSAGALVSFVLWKLGPVTGQNHSALPTDTIPISNQIWRLLWSSKCTTPGQLLHIAWHSFQAVFQAATFSICAGCRKVGSALLDGNCWNCRMT